jgi:hypothetical protein
MRNIMRYATKIKDKYNKKIKEHEEKAEKLLKILIIK